MPTFAPRKTRVAQFHFAPKNCRSLQPQPQPHHYPNPSPKVRRGVRAYGHVITKIYWMDRLPNFVKYGAPFARASRSCGTIFSNLTKMELRYYCFVSVITDLFSLYVLFNVGHVIHSREFFHLNFVLFPCICTHNLRKDNGEIGKNIGKTKLTAGHLFSSFFFCTACSKTKVHSWKGN